MHRASLRYGRRIAGPALSGWLFLALIGPAWAQPAFELQLSGFLGGTDPKHEQVRDMAFDSLGNIYMTGGTASSDFPTTPGAYDRTFGGEFDTFVVKLDPAGNLLWSTLIGGPAYDRAYAVEIDDQDFVYVAGRCGPGYPTTAGALQTTFGGTNNPVAPYFDQDGCVTKFSPAGAVVWSTFFGGAGAEFIRDIDVDSAGNVYVAMPDNHFVPQPHITAGAYQTAIAGERDSVIAKISADGSSVVWGSYIGGSAYDGEAPSIRVDAGGHAYYLFGTQSDDAPATVNAFQSARGGGKDLMLAKFSPDGSSLVWATYFGGNGSETLETHDLEIDSAGRAIIVATTLSTDLPTTPGAFQGSAPAGWNTFAARLSADGSNLEACTYFGGSSGDYAEGTGFDVAGNVYFSGSTESSDLPVTPDAIQSTLSGNSDMFVAVLSPDMTQLRYATRVGGTGIEASRTLIVGPNGDVLFGGITTSPDFPIASAVQGTLIGGGDATYGLLRPASPPGPDADGDGVEDAQDNCPGVPNAGQANFDGDAAGDACDGCPTDAGKIVPGQCGCGVPETDGDGDGTPNCNDNCPSDPLKTEPGNCGCGLVDADQDMDTICDGLDNCPATANLNQLDGDSDGYGDACDRCPVDCAECDANGDGRIDGTELAWVGRAFVSCSPNPSGEWWYHVDYDLDGCVDGDDLAILSMPGIWGESSTSCVATN